MKLTYSNSLNFDIDQYNDLMSEVSKIDTHNINNEMAKHPATFSHYHGILTYIKKNLDKATLLLEVWQANFETDLMNGPKRSVAQVQALIKSQAEYQSLSEEVIRLESIYNLIKSICISLDHKKDMLVQLSANGRMETKLYS